MCARYNIFPPDAEETAAILFEAADEDGNGLVSESEFEGIVELFDRGITEDEIEDLFNFEDENGDGNIDLQEAVTPNVVPPTGAPTPGSTPTLSPTPPLVSSSKSNKSNPCAMIKGKKAKKKCLSKLKKPF